MKLNVEAIKGKEFRQVYTELLCELAEKDERIWVLEADLMKASGTTPFKEKFPDRFIDVGVAEANMIGVAAGIANMGGIPFAHSFTPFATRRAFDQITISVSYSALPVKIGGTDPGVTAELNGGTHMSFEDAGIMRNLANIVIVEPVDVVQFAGLLPQIVEHDSGPVYMRLNRKTKEIFFNGDENFELGKIYKVKDGKDLTIIASGIMLGQAMKASEELEKEGYSIRVLNMHTLKPVDREEIVRAAKETGRILVAENHSVINGWGSAVAEVVVKEYPVPMEFIGIQDHFGEVGTLQFLMEKYHLTAKDIYQKARDLLSRG